MATFWLSGVYCARMTGKCGKSPGGSSVVEQWTVKRLRAAIHWSGVQISLPRCDVACFFVPKYSGLPITRVAGAPRVHPFGDAALSIKIFESNLGNDQPQSKLDGMMREKYK